MQRSQGYGNYNERIHGQQPSTFDNIRYFCTGFASNQERVQVISEFISAHKTELFIFGLAMASLAFGPWPTTMLVSKKVIATEIAEGFLASCLAQIVFVAFKAEGLAGETGRKIQGLATVMTLASAIIDPAELVVNSLQLFGMTLASITFNLMQLSNKQKDQKERALGEAESKDSFEMIPMRAAEPVGAGAPAAAAPTAARTRIESVPAGRRSRRPVASASGDDSDS